MKQFNNEKMPEQNKSDSKERPARHHGHDLQAIRVLEERLSSGTIDRDGFNQLVMHYFESIFKHFKARCLIRFNIYNEQLIEDLFQDTLNNIWKRVAEKAEIKSFVAYFNTATKNILIDHFKKQKSCAKYNLPLDDLVKEPVASNKNDAFFLEELNKLLTPFANELDRKIYIMYLTGFSYELIQKELNCTHARVGNTIFAINELLRENFKVIDEILIGSYHP